MATRTKLVESAVVSITTYEDVGTPIRPPAGIKWTLVEFSIAFGLAGAAKKGHARIKFDEEIYHDIHSAIHNTSGTGGVKNREIVAIDIIQPHELKVQAVSNEVGDIDVIGQLTIEESAATA